DYTIERDSISIIIEKNLQGKIDSYIKKHNKDDAPIRVEITLKREKDAKASGKLVVTIVGKAYRSERENFDNVHDLVNHLFTHLKDQLAK
ncbi:hypothetical protein KBD33_05490, partial [Candidatus Gracilibacteria bacterium]|nr:hypothetical protein [Candidatus Gracilibacteria bacterium]